jgi:hypothetical protein
LGAASAAARPTGRRHRLKLPGFENPGEAEMGVGTGPETDTDRGATTTIVDATAITMQGRVTFLSDAPVSASCSVRTSPTAITA